MKTLITLALALVLFASCTKNATPPTYYCLIETGGGIVPYMATPVSYTGYDPKGFEASHTDTTHPPAWQTCHCYTGHPYAN